MKIYLRYVLSSLLIVLLSSQISLMAYAHHADNSGKNAREAAKDTTKKIQDDKKEKGKKIQNAYNAYKEAFKMWKSTRDVYYTAISNGDQNTIDLAKSESDKAFTEKNEKWVEYQKIKKENE